MANMDRAAPPTTPPRQTKEPLMLSPKITTAALSPPQERSKTKEELERLHKYREEFEAARGFDSDDDSMFFPAGDGEKEEKKKKMGMATEEKKAGKKSKKKK